MSDTVTAGGVPIQSAFGSGYVGWVELDVQIPEERIPEERIPEESAKFQKPGYILHESSAPSLAVSVESPPVAVRAGFWPAVRIADTRWIS